MTTATTTMRNATTETEGRPRRSLEELVDRLIDALFAPTPTAAERLLRSVHEARRARQAGDLDGALAIMGALETTGTPEHRARWAHAEWLDLARRRFAGADALVYGPGTGRAAILLPADDGTLTVAATLGLRWAPGRTLSPRCLRGLRPLRKGAPS